MSSLSLWWWHSCLTCFVDLIGDNEPHHRVGSFWLSPMFINSNFKNLTHVPFQFLLEYVPIPWNKTWAITASFFFLQSAVTHFRNCGENRKRQLSPSSTKSNTKNNTVTQFDYLEDTGMFWVHELVARRKKREKWYIGNLAAASLEQSSPSGSGLVLRRLLLMMVFIVYTVFPSCLAHRLSSFGLGQAHISFHWPSP